MPDILIPEAIVGAPLDELAREHDMSIDAELWRNPPLLREKIVETRALIVRNQTRVNAELLAAAPRLQIVGRAGVGLDNIDVDAASAAGVVVSFTPQANAVSVAELALGAMLALARKIPAADRDTRGGGWNRLRYTGVELAGRTLGIVGFGRIGRMTAERARAFGMRLLVSDPVLTADSSALSAAGARLCSLDALLAAADVVTVHAPLTPDTNCLFDAACFGRMKPGAFFVNTSRGELVDESALLEALQLGRLSGAALDVRRSEPPDPSPFDKLDNVILLPHVGAFTIEAQHRTLEAVRRDITAVLSGGEAIEYVNFARPHSRRA